MGHPSSLILHKLADILSFSKPSANKFCEPCQLGKSSRLPFGSSLSSTSRPLELLHSDVWGSAPLSSMSGFRYYVLFVDDYSRYSWLFPIQCKSDVFTVFLSSKLQIENMLSLKIKCFQSIGGKEFVNNKFKHLFYECGIVHQLSCPRTPEQNGCAERKHRHIVETGLTLLFNASMPAHYWADAFSTATYLINRMPMHSLRFQLPWQQLFRSSPNYMTLNVFGCACYPWLRPYSQHKLEPRTKRCVFLGYTLDYNGYRCLNPSTGRLYISKHVIVYEHTFPFAFLPGSTSVPIAITDWLPNPCTIPSSPPSISSSSPIISSNSSSPSLASTAIELLPSISFLVTTSTALVPNSSPYPTSPSFCTICHNLGFFYRC